MTQPHSPWRSFILAALFEILLLVLLMYLALKLINPVSWPLFVLLLVILQFPTALLVLLLEWLMPGGFIPGVPTSVVYMVLLFVGQTAVFTWWLNFRAKRGTWRPSTDGAGTAS